MATHETLLHDNHVEPGSDRSFGLIVGGILAAIGAFQYFGGSALYLAFAGPGALLVIFGLVAPKLLHPLNVLWTKLGLLLGRIVTPVVMFLVYATTVVPIGLLLRLFGKDLLRLKPIDADGSYWINRSPPGPSPESLKDQF